MGRLPADCHPPLSSILPMVHYAEHAVSVDAEILKHELIAKETLRIRLAVPPAMCRAVPGQFFMVRDARKRSADRAGICSV